MAEHYRYHLIDCMMLTVEIHTSWYRSLLVKNDTSEGHVLEYSSTVE